MNPNRSVKTNKCLQCDTTFKAGLYKMNDLLQFTFLSYKRLFLIGQIVIEIICP